MGERVAGVLRDRLLVVLGCPPHRFGGALVPAEAPAEVELVGCGVFRAALQRRRAFVAEQLDLQRVDDGERDLVLDIEDVPHLTVVALGPEVETVSGVHQLHRDRACDRVRCGRSPRGRS